MTIIELLKDKNIFDARVSYGKRWLVYIYGSYQVFEHRYRAKKSTTLIITDNEEDAVAKLIEG